MSYGNVEAWQCSEKSLLNLQKLLEVRDFNNSSVVMNSVLGHLRLESCNLIGVV